MSGGHFNYVDSHLKDEIFGWGNKPTNEFEDLEISELVWDVLELIHHFDWYKSGDTRKETYLKHKADFKKKWMGNRGVRVRRIVDDALSGMKEELYETFGLIEEDCVVRCKNCRKYDLETQCCKFWPDEGYRHPDHFCAEGERRE